MDLVILIDMQDVSSFLGFEGVYDNLRFSTRNCQEEKDCEYRFQIWAVYGQSNDGILVTNWSCTLCWGLCCKIDSAIADGWSFHHVTYTLQV